MPEKNLSNTNFVYGAELPFVANGTPNYSIQEKKESDKPVDLTRFWIGVEELSSKNNTQRSVARVKSYFSRKIASMFSRK